MGHDAAHGHAHDGNGHDADTHDHTGHDHASHHHHGHHHHHHAPADGGGLAFAVGVALNLAFLIGEAAAGIWSGSLALLSDAGHNLGDVLGLAASWTALILTRRAPRGRYTYGLGSSTILAAFLNALVLLVTVGVIAVEAIERLITPGPVVPAVMVVVGTIGIAVNGLSALLFRHDHGDVNRRAAFLHLAGDAAFSAAVVVTGLIVARTGWLWLDPMVSLVLAALIARATWGLFRDSLDLALHAAPRALDPAVIGDFLRSQPMVMAIHDLHIWPLSTQANALTVHVRVADAHPGDAFVAGLCARLRDRFGIGHATIQVETEDHGACALEPDHVI